MEITIAHSPDADDAFMHHALAAGEIDCGPYRFRHVLADIESLNTAAQEGRYEVTAISVHAWPRVADRYLLLGSGASAGEGYGPLVISREPAALADLSGRRVLLPGRWTTAHLVFCLACPEAEVAFAPFDAIAGEVAAGKADAGVIIHEGQLTCPREGFAVVADLGVWWSEQTGGLPLPLGGNAIRRDLGPRVIVDVARLLAESVSWALDHPEAALDGAMACARGLDRADARRFVGMYVNRRTLDWGDDGRAAVELLLARGCEAGLIDRPVAVEWASPRGRPRAPSASWPTRGA